MGVLKQLLVLLRGSFSGTRANLAPAQIALLASFAVLLQVSAGVGLAYWAGFHRVDVTLGRFEPIWLAGIVGGLVVSFVGYLFAYRGIFSVAGGRNYERRTFAAIVAAGFGGFLARGGGSVDRYALQGSGFDDRDARARVGALAGLEHGILGLGGFACALFALAAGYHKPPADVLYPWAILPVPGFAIAFYLEARYRERPQHRQGKWEHVSVFLKSVHYARELLLRPAPYWSATGGMALFWAADAFAVWCGMRSFGYAMNAAQLFVGFGTGMIFTRRTGPLGGAGILTVAVPLSLWYCGAPLALATVGFFTCQIFSSGCRFPSPSRACRRCSA